MTNPPCKPRWYHLTPARFFLGLLAVQVLLLLSERFQWFTFNEKKGWTVLITDEGVKKLQRALPDCSIEH
jgi:hypothetical protein